mmetsp:Transcript_34236/g.55041  ORF Transcript_34236/g.55041 Transcript_34236/m.55041 type:complete len:109 (-) Transcript_34236:247-573(-)
MQESVLYNYYDAVDSEEDYDDDDFIISGPKREEEEEDEPNKEKEVSTEEDSWAGIGNRQITRILGGRIDTWKCQLLTAAQIVKGTDDYKRRKEKYEQQNSKRNREFLI